jgi:hypothetical protein
VQLGDFLNEGGTKKVNIIAINWMENADSKFSLRRLNKLVRTFHPVIRVVRSNEEIETYFQPLTNVPMSFIFKKTGHLIYGNGKQAFLGKDRLSKILSDTP